MKNITLLMLAFFLSTLGYSQQEGFEGASLPDPGTGQWVLDSGTWAVFDNGVGTNNSWTVNTTVTTPPLVNSGSRAAFITNENIGMNNTSRDFLASPLFAIPNNGQLRFFTRTTQGGNQGTTFKVMVSTTVQNDPAAYTTVQTWTENQLNAVYNIYEEKVVDLSAYEGTSVYVAFVSEFTQPTPALGGDRWLIDDIRFVEQCVNPTTLTAGNITQTSAQLSWANPGGPNTFEIEIVPFTDAPTGNGVLVTGTTYLATATTTPVADFTPSTQYKFYVRAICGDVPSEWVGPIGFATSSPGLSCVSPIVIAPGVPYSTTDNTGNYQDLYDVAQPGACAGTTSNYMTGNDVFYSYTPTENGAINITMTPTGTYSGIFVYAGCENVGVNCVAGVANSSTAVREISNLAVTAGVEYIIVLSSNANPQTFGYTLTLQELNCAPPVSLSATGTGPNSVNLSWQDPAGATSWEYFVQVQGGAIPTAEGVTTTSNTSVPVSTLTGTTTELQLGTTYQYWVRSDCGDGTFSPWAGPYVFNTTSCTTGCNYTFVMRDTYGDSWNGNTMNVVQDGVVVQVLTGPTSAQDDVPVPVSIALCDGPFQLFWNAGGSYPGEVQISIVNSFGQTIYSMTNGATALQNTVLYSGTVDCTTPACLAPNTLTSVTPTTDGATLSWIANGPNPASWEIYAVPSGSPAPTDATTPTVTGVTSNPYTITGLLADTTYVYYVRAVCSETSSSPWSAVSTTFTTLPTCPKPTALEVSNITMTSATFDWTAGGAETAWEVLVLAAGAPAPTATSTGWVPATAHPFTMDTFTAGTAYSVYVRAVCSDSDSSTWAGPLNFATTICDPADQCMYTFTMIDTFGDSWNGNTMNVIQNDIVIAVLTGPTNAQGTTPVTVQVPLCDDLPFQLFWNAGGSFAGEVSVSITNSFGQVIYTKAGGTGAQNSLLYSGVNDCDNPLCLPPSGLTATNVSQNSVTLAWTPNGPETSWQVIAVPANAPAPTDASDWTDAPTNPFVVTGLTDATSYDFYIRAVCSATDLSPIAGPYRTITAQIPATLDYTETFEGDIEWALSNGTLTNKWIVGTATSNGGTHSLYISNNNTANAYTTGSAAIVHAYRDIQMPAVAGEMVLNFDWKAVGEGFTTTRYDYIRVWAVPTNYVPTPGTLIAAGDGRIQIGGYFNNKNTWQSEEFIFQANSFSNAALRLVFEWRNDGSGGSQPPGAIDNVMLSAISCPTPQNLVASNTPTVNQLELTWTPIGTETQWEIVVQEAGGPAPANGEIVASPSYFFDAIPGTFYEFYVRAICSDEDSSFWSPAQPFSIFTPPGCASVNLFAVDVEIVDNEIFVCPGETACVNLSANYFGIAGTDSYEVTAIDYDPPFPFTGGIEMPITSDDDYTASFDLPFNFCFFGNAYEYCRIGDNGVITFGMPYTDEYGDYCPWTIDGPIPSTQFDIKNSIFGIFQDMYTTNNPGPNSSINYQVLGTYPCRALVVNFNEVPAFGSSCTDPQYRTTTQIVLYEISNIIEVYVKNRTACTGWQDGDGVLGIINATGNIAYTPPGRNTGAWNASNEAWRFAPSGESNVEFTWFKDGEFYSNEQDIEVCISADTEMVAQAKYMTCYGEITTTSDVTIRTTTVLLETNDPIDIESCSATGNLVFDLTPNTPIILDGLTDPNIVIEYYLTEADAQAGTNPLTAEEIVAFEGTAGQTIYVRIEYANSQCTLIKSFDLIIGDNTPAVVDFSYATPFCSDAANPLPALAQGFTQGGQFSSDDVVVNPTTGEINLAASPEGNFNVTYTLAATGCREGGVFTAPVSIGSATADVVEPVTACGSYMLPALPANNTYYTGSQGTGSAIAVGATIDTPGVNTIYVLADVNGCTDETSFTVTITPEPEFKITSFCDGNNFMLMANVINNSYNPEAVTYTWANEGGEIVGSTTGSTAMVQGAGTYTLTINSGSCTPVSVPFVASHTGCLPQKGISPNGDGYNDYFDLVGQDVRLLEIFNRYGRTVYKKKNYSNEWYGQTDKGDELPDGTYYYVMERGSGETLTGWIYINREQN